MKIKSLLSEYKRIAKEMKEEAKKYNYLSSAVRRPYCSDKTFAEYQKSWKKLISLNNEAYNIMHEYRTLCGSTLYKAMFFLGVLPKQHTFRFVDDTKTWYKATSMMSLLNLN